MESPSIKSWRVQIDTKDFSTLLYSPLFLSFSYLVYFAEVVSPSRFYSSSFTQEDLRISRNPPTYYNFHEFSVSFPLKLRFTMRKGLRLVCGLDLLNVYWGRGYGGFACKLLEFIAGLDVPRYTPNKSQKYSNATTCRRNFIRGYIMRAVWTIFISTYC